MALHSVGTFFVSTPQVLPCSAFESMLRAELAAATTRAHQAMADAADAAVSTSTARAQQRFAAASQEAKRAAAAADESGEGVAACEALTRRAAAEAVADLQGALQQLEEVEVAFEAEVKPHARFSP